jgi:hypothetical protein
MSFQVPMPDSPLVRVSGVVLCFDVEKELTNARRS